jgi:hypothetical protein
MADSNANKCPETISRGVKIPNNSDDLPAIIRQIRLCRSTLGAILDVLESGDGHADAIERIAECTTGVSAEIESLWNAAKPVD